jgi:serine/threonine protein kinase
MDKAPRPRLGTEVFDYGQAEIEVDGGEFNHYWYTMEKCESSVHSNYPSMPLPRRVDVVMQTLDALAFLHAKDIAHRGVNRGQPLQETGDTLLLTCPARA